MTDSSGKGSAGIHHAEARLRTIEKIEHGFWHLPQLINAFARKRRSWRRVVLSCGTAGHRWHEFTVQLHSRTVFSMQILITNFPFKYMLLSLLSSVFIFIGLSFLFLIISRNVSYCGITTW